MEAIDVLNKCAEIQKERGAEYEVEGCKERSMADIVAAFNAVTGHNLNEVEGWYFMEVLKAKRFFTALDNGKVHTDSLVDAVSYASLRAESGFALAPALSPAENPADTQHEFMRNNPNDATDIGSH